MPYPLQPSACRGVRQRALIFSLCVLSLAVPLLTAGPGEFALLGPHNHSPAEITALDLDAIEESDSYLVIPSLSLIQEPSLVDPRPMEAQFLAHGPALRPSVPPPEIPRPA